MLEASRTDCGVSAVWVFANLSFTAMRAQARGSTLWKVLSFIFGFPGTLLTLLVVTEGKRTGLRDRYAAEIWNTIEDDPIL
jgi:hypothetical protein